MTDANLLLGYLGSRRAAGRRRRARPRRRAAAAIGALAGELGLDPIACAEGIVRVANAEMVRALRVVTVERGIDPRDYALLAFGGAGPLHAAQIADELGIDTVLCPRASGVLAALGLVVSPAPPRRPAHGAAQSGAALTAEAIAERRRRARRAGSAGARSEPKPSLRATYELRYRGQSFELPVPSGADPTPDELREAFEAEHRGPLRLQRPRADARARDDPGDRDQRRRGGRAAAPAEQPAPPAWPARGHVRRRPARARRAARRAGARRRRIDGPAVVELPESTLLVPPGWPRRSSETGTIVHGRER